MCHPTTCRACQKTTWAGCGSHVAQVKARVPSKDWCRCTDAEKAAARTPSLMSRLFGR